MTGNLVAFLRDRLDEDATEIASYRGEAYEAAPWALEVGMDHDGYWTIHTPQPRAGREVEAKRRLLDLHRVGVSHRDDGQPVCAACRKSRMYPCEVVRLLALPYADHPDYREEWKP